MTWFSSLHPIVQALIATLFTWALTAIGAGSVFIFKTINRCILDGMLAFAAGAMIYVVVEELIPESQQQSSADVATFGAILGFTLMMILDVALG